jgi:hypothetical protein
MTAPLVQKDFFPLFISRKDDDKSVNLIEGRQVPGGKKRGGWEIKCGPPKEYECEKNQYDSCRKD